MNELKPKTISTKMFLYHPTSIIVLILLDWGGFVLEVPQLLSPGTLFLTFIILYIISYLLIYFLQQHFAGDDKKTATLKALLGGLICAMPAPIMGSIIGSIILALSGFENVKQFGIEGLFSMFRKKKKQD